MRNDSSTSPPLSFAPLLWCAGMWRIAVSRVSTWGILIAMLSAGRASWIDIETPLDKRTAVSFVDGTTYELVMSDEFNVENRSFRDGHDPLWTALDKPDNDANAAGGGSLHFYNSTNVRTRGGMLEIDTKVGTTQWNHYDTVNKKWRHIQTNFTSGMVQSWNKFCFTGGIVEVDVAFPGDPFIGGLWPAVWMLGNLGRATYEASTNNIWPWSYNTCDRQQQRAQTISACNQNNHFGMHPFQGRGATEIDVVEVMTGNSNGPLPGTDPPVSLPYCDMTLQVAPGVPQNRPQTGSPPIRQKSFSKSGHTEFAAQTWYEGLEMHGNTSINPFFYGTFLDKTKPGEPVTRTKEEAFQADAIGAAHQLTLNHFLKPHTFRVEWQPGPGGRLDWYAKGGHKINANGTDEVLETDGNGTEWIHAFSIKDKSLYDLMGSQIPAEPTYLIMNTAISSTWGFPYDAPEWCPKCYDCNDPKCACRFYPGFCRMLTHGVTMRIDSVRVYQSPNDRAHAGMPHTLGCDPPQYPTKDWILGHEYQYMRGAPFSYDDTGPLRPVQRGGGQCRTDKDCGGDLRIPNLTAVFETGDYMQMEMTNGRGTCYQESSPAFFGVGAPASAGGFCNCREGFTGPRCLAIDFGDEYPSAHDISAGESPFISIAEFQLPWFLLVVLGSLAIMVVYCSHKSVENRKSLSFQSFKSGSHTEETPLLYRQGNIPGKFPPQGHLQVAIVTLLLFLPSESHAWLSGRPWKGCGRSTPEKDGFHMPTAEHNKKVAQMIWKDFLCATISTGLVFLPLSPLTSLPTHAAPPLVEHMLVPPGSQNLLIPSPSTWTSSLTLAAEEDATSEQSAIDEAWTLIDKYYLDRTFHNQDWLAVREKYSNVKDEMKGLTEMVGLLGDKYSRVLTADQYAAIQKYDLIGVGATLMPNADKEIMVGAPPIPGSAAAKADLRVGDIVQAVNGVSTDGRTAFDIIDQIAEDNINAEKITMTIRKKDDPRSEAVDYVLDRQFQKVQNPVTQRVTESRPDGTRVGYVRISEFNALVKPSLEEALRNLVRDGANAFVLDLRGNGGGAFQSAVEISSLFLSEPPAVATYVVDGTMAEIPFKSASGHALVQNDDPVVIWMDGRTASASEVFSAALHDNCRATLAGQPSFGKGLIQAVYGLKNGAGLVLTVAKYVTPNHDEIQNVGLTPDVEGMVPGSLLPGLYSSDTSQVDFEKAKEQLKLCHRPELTLANSHSTGST